MGRGEGEGLGGRAGGGAGCACGGAAGGIAIGCEGAASPAALSGASVAGRGAASGGCPRVVASAAASSGGTPSATAGSMASVTAIGAGHVCRGASPGNAISAARVAPCSATDVISQPTRRPHHAARSLSSSIRLSRSCTTRQICRSEIHIRTIAGSAAAVMPTRRWSLRLLEHPITPAGRTGCPPYHSMIKRWNEGNRRVQLCRLSCPRWVAAKLVVYFSPKPSARSTPIWAPQISAICSHTMFPAAQPSAASKEGAI